MLRSPVLLLTCYMYVSFQISKKLNNIKLSQYELNHVIMYVIQCLLSQQFALCVYVYTCTCQLL